MKERLEKILEMKQHPDTLEPILIDELSILEFINNKYSNIFIYLNLKDLLTKLYTERNKTIELNNFISINKIANQNNNWFHLFKGQQNDPHELLAYIQHLIHETKYKPIIINFDTIYPSDDSRESRIKK